MPYSNELALAQEAAKKAGEYLRTKEAPSAKFDEGKDIKLSTDKNSEKIILETLSCSGFPVLSEEKGMVGDSGSDKYWIVDPLDGSANYLKGLYELTCVSIALWDNGMPVLGVVYRWAYDELMWGVVGEGAFMNGEALAPNQTDAMRIATLATGFPVARNYGDEALFSFVKLVQSFRKIRMFGAAAISCSFVARGMVDAYIEEEIMLWDVAAAMAIVQAAGGSVDFTMLENNKCICACFATEELMKDYQALRGENA